MAKILDCDIAVSEFELHSCYYINMGLIPLAKGMNPLIPISYGLNSTKQLSFNNAVFGII